uniref:(California timema) hypothetical protein n=1 Tax=Timema californicum TaxID=61474 RepID=A0A7R9P7P7_TIMCA|nr:unnamed protein product [Timema californicum]
MGSSKPHIFTTLALELQPALDSQCGSKRYLVAIAEPTPPGSRLRLRVPTPATSMKQCTCSYPSTSTTGCTDLAPLPSLSLIEPATGVGGATTEGGESEQINKTTGGEAHHSGVSRCG